MGTVVMLTKSGTCSLWIDLVYFFYRISSYCFTLPNSNLRLVKNHDNKNTTDNNIFWFVILLFVL